LDYLRSALDGKRGALEGQPTKHVRTHTHKLKPLNHITVVPNPLSPLRFNTEFSPNTPRSLYLTNIGDVPVHLTKGYVIGTVTAYNGLLHVVEEEEEPGAVLTMGADPRDKPDEEVKTGRQAEERIDEGQPPPHPPDKTYPKPEVHREGVPDTLRGDVDDLLKEYKALWPGQLGKVDVTPHLIKATPGARPRRAKPYRASHASRDIIAK